MTGRGKRDATGPPPQGEQSHNGGHMINANDSSRLHGTASDSKELHSNLVLLGTGRVTSQKTCEAEVQQQEPCDLEKGRPPAQIPETNTQQDESLIQVTLTTDTVAKVKPPSFEGSGQGDGGTSQVHKPILVAGTEGKVIHFNIPRIPRPPLRPRIRNSPLSAPGDARIKYLNSPQSK